MSAFLVELSRRTFIRYIGASGCATVVDLSLFMALLETGMNPAAAAALGYCAGILTHWLISSRAVFADGVAPRGIGRNVQKALFIGFGILGLCITTAIVGLGDSVGLDPRLAKLAAMAMSFLVTYMLRRHVVFAQRIKTPVMPAPGGSLIRHPESQGQRTWLWTPDQVRGDGE